MGFAWLKLIPVWVPVTQAVCPQTWEVSEVPCLMGKRVCIRSEQQTEWRLLLLTETISFWQLQNSTLAFFFCSTQSCVEISKLFPRFHHTSQLESPPTFHLRWNLASSSTCLMSDQIKCRVTETVCQNFVWATNKDYASHMIWIEILSLAGYTAVSQAWVGGINSHLPCVSVFFGFFFSP